MAHHVARSMLSSRKLRDHESWVSTGGQARPVDIHRFFAAGVVDDEDIAIGQQIREREPEGPYGKAERSVCLCFAAIWIAMLVDDDLTVRVEWCIDGGRHTRSYRAGVEAIHESEYDAAIGQHGGMGGLVLEPEILRLRPGVTTVSTDTAVDVEKSLRLRIVSPQKGGEATVGRQANPLIAIVDSAAGIESGNCCFPPCLPLVA